MSEPRRSWLQAIYWGRLALAVLLWNALILADRMMSEEGELGMLAYLASALAAIVCGTAAAGKPPGGLFFRFDDIAQRLRPLLIFLALTCLLPFAVLFAQKW